MIIKKLSQCTHQSKSSKTFYIVLTKKFFAQNSVNYTYSVIHFVKVRKFIVSLESLLAKGETWHRVMGWKVGAKKKAERAFAKDKTVSNYSAFQTNW